MIMMTTTMISIKPIICHLFSTAQFVFTLNVHFLMKIYNFPTKMCNLSTTIYNPSIKMCNFLSKMHVYDYGDYHHPSDNMMTEYPDIYIMTVCLYLCVWRKSDHQFDCWWWRYIYYDGVSVSLCVCGTRALTSLPRTWWTHLSKAPSIERLL